MIIRSGRFISRNGRHSYKCRFVSNMQPLQNPFFTSQNPISYVTIVTYLTLHSYKVYNSETSNDQKRKISRCFRRLVQRRYSY